MRILVLNGSPSGKNSITLYTMLYIQKFFKEHTYEVIHVGQRIKAIEKDFAPSKKALEEADLIIFCYPVYTFLVPAQLHRFLELMKEHQVDLSGKFVTQITTSKHFYDMTAHQFIEDNCRDLHVHYIPGLSQDMDDLTKKQGRKEALSFFRFVLFHMSLEQDPAVREEKTSSFSGRIALVTDAKEGTLLWDMTKVFADAVSGKTEIINLREFPFAGGCLGCFHCAADGTCIYKDGFDSFLREKIQTADAIVYAYTVKDHSMGSLFKTYDDRQFCNGHRTVTMGKPVAYLVEGDLSKEPNLMTLMQARGQVGGNFLAGVVDTGDKEAALWTQEIGKMAKVLEYAILHAYQPPKNFYGVGGLKVFRDLIYEMQGLMREDHRFYKKHGFYDFPQTKKGRIAAMYLVGAMMNNKKLMKKIGGRMTEGMVMPYKKVLEEAKEEE